IFWRCLVCSRKVSGVRTRTEQLADSKCGVQQANAQGWTDNSWGPRAIGDHGAPVSTPTHTPHPKKPMKGTRGISWGPLLTPGPRAVPKFPN
ncbi:unnamed protein product, partial [Staurois parvus]